MSYQWYYDPSRWYDPSRFQPIQSGDLTVFQWGQQAIGQPPTSMPGMLPGQPPASMLSMLPGPVQPVAPQTQSLEALLQRDEKCLVLTGKEFADWNVRRMSRHTTAAAAADDQPAPTLAAPADRVEEALVVGENAEATAAVVPGHPVPAGYATEQIGPAPSSIFDIDIPGTWMPTGYATTEQDSSASSAGFDALGASTWEDEFFLTSIDPFFGPSDSTGGSLDVNGQGNNAGSTSGSQIQSLGKAQPGLAEGVAYSQQQPNLLHDLQTDHFGVNEDLVYLIGQYSNREELKTRAKNILDVSVGRYKRVIAIVVDEPWKLTGKEFVTIEHWGRDGLKRPKPKGAPADWRERREYAAVVFHRNKGPIQTFRLHLKGRNCVPDDCANEGGVDERKSTNKKRKRKEPAAIDPPGGDNDNTGNGVDNDGSGHGAGPATDPNGAAPENPDQYDTGSYCVRKSHGSGKEKELGPEDKQDDCEKPLSWKRDRELIKLMAATSRYAFDTEVSEREPSGAEAGDGTSTT